MTDLRQGVTDSQHMVLDFVENEIAQKFADWPCDKILEVGAGAAISAAQSKDMKARRDDAIHGAAFLLHAIAQLDAAIEAAIATASDGDDGA